MSSVKQENTNLATTQENSDDSGAIEAHIVKDIYTSYSEESLKCTICDTEFKVKVPLRSTY